MYETQWAIASAEAVDLQLEVHGEPPELWGDRDRLAQVLENLNGILPRFSLRSLTKVQGEFSLA